MPDKPILNTAKFDLLESVWLVGAPSYIIHADHPIDYSNDKWRQRWYISQTTISIMGIKIEPTLNNKLFYVFPGNGCDDGSRMFRDRDAALAAIKRHNDNLP